MLYFSQILNSKITDSADVSVGRLRDIIIKPKAGEYAQLYFLVVEKRRRGVFYIPYEYVANISREEISLKTLLGKVAVQTVQPDDAIYLKRDVLDQQIVDVGGARVVRVNDLRLGDFENRVCVLGIDVSVRGLLRRLGLEWLDFLNIMKVNLIDWRATQPVKGFLRLDKVSEKLHTLHPADLANIVEDLSVKHGSRLVRALKVEEAAKVLEEVDPHLQKIMIKHLGPEQAALILSKMSVEELVDLLRMLPKSEAQEYLAHLHNGRLNKVQRLLGYPDDSAGGLMTTEYISCQPEITVKQAIAEIKRQSATLRSVLFIYVVDPEGRFLGPVSVRNLLVANASEKLGEILKPAESLALLHPDYSLTQVVEVMTKYDLYTAAVVGENRKLLGVVSIDDVMRELKPNA